MKLSKDNHPKIIIDNEIAGANKNIKTFNRDTLISLLVISFIASAIGRGRPKRDTLLGPIRKCI